MQDSQSAQLSTYQTLYYPCKQHECALLPVMCIILNAKQYIIGNYWIHFCL